MTSRRHDYSDFVNSVIKKTMRPRPVGFEHHAIVVNTGGKEVKEESGISCSRGEWRQTKSYWPFTTCRNGCTI